MSDILDICREIVNMNVDDLHRNFTRLMQDLMNCGGDEFLINNDCGMWAIGEEGSQNISGDECFDLTTCFEINGDMFCETIPESLRKYAEKVIEECDEE